MFMTLLTFLYFFIHKCLLHDMVRSAFDKRRAKYTIFSSKHVQKGMFGLCDIQSIYVPVCTARLIVCLKYTCQVPTLCCFLDETPFVVLHKIIDLAMLNLLEIGHT